MPPGPHLLALQRHAGNRAVVHYLAAAHAPESVQRGGVLGIAGISDAVERKAVQANLEDELRFAVARCQQQDIGSVALVELVFSTLSAAQLERTPRDGDGVLWKQLADAQRELGATPFANWLAKAKFKVLDIPEMKMLLTDQSARGAQEQAAAIMARAQKLPRFAGVAYEEIVGQLKGRGFVRQEKYNAVTEEDLPYGQDVWTSDDQLVVRIKVGGRSINGRFPRPPHVVKEVTRKAHAYAPAEIIAKLTDDNVLIPAGTKYSAKDIQTWYNKEAGGNLAKEAWQDPEGSGDADFIALFKRWTEGAHTTIGDVPALPSRDHELPERNRQVLRAHRYAMEQVHGFEEFVDGSIVRPVDARGQNQAINQGLAGVNKPHRAKVERLLSDAEDAVYQNNLKMYWARRDKIRSALHAWREALILFFKGEPPVKKTKEFYRKIYADMFDSVTSVDTSPWEKLKPQ
jgi:hypothetical protein